MKYKYELKNGVEAQVWINENPFYSNKIERLISEEMVGNSELKAYNRQIILELYLPKNISYYAMLGLKYTVTESNKLIVNLNVNSEDGEIVKDNIALSSDEVRIGVIEEYAIALVELLRQKSKEGNVPNGEMCIDIGAYCEAGSSQAIFKKVLGFLLEIIQMEDIDNSSILNYFENTANYKIGI